MIEASGEQWLSFNVREDYLSGLTVGKTVSVTRDGTGDPIKSVITELRPLGVFATWQAERAGLEPGMTVWIERQQSSRK